MDKFNSIEITLRVPIKNRRNPSIPETVLYRIEKKGLFYTIQEKETIAGKTKSFMKFGKPYWPYNDLKNFFSHQDFSNLEKIEGFKETQIDSPYILGEKDFLVSIAMMLG